MIVIDTDILSLVLWEQNADANTLTSRLVSSDPVIRVTIVTVEEQLKGWLARIAMSRELRQQVDAYSRLHRMIEDFRDVEILDFDSAAAATFAQLKSQRIRIGTMDLRIAAIALANDALLISRNLVDFQKVPGLRVEDWTVN